MKDAITKCAITQEKKPKEKINNPRYNPIKNG
jgi:hypothetical protein